MNAQIVSKKRVAEHGEVFTAEREVKAMCDLVKPETERIGSRFLEPACGKGAFLSEILKRKLRVVGRRYAKSRIEYERYSVIAVSSIYGIDILKDNVEDCRKILLSIYKDAYKKNLKNECAAEFSDCIAFILSKNIIWGDALSLKKADGSENPIVFSEWSGIKENRLIKRRDFEFKEILGKTDEKLPLIADMEEERWFPVPIKEFPPTEYLRLSDADKS